MPESKYPKNSHSATGAAGEEEALRYLARQGFRLAARNWRPEGVSRNLELDLVGEWEACLVFVEVKTRHATGMDPAEGPAGLRNFTPAKRNNMVRAAEAYLAAHDAWDRPCRFDLVCVTLLPARAQEGRTSRMDHYRNVIELGKTLDSRDTAWQPW